MRYKMVVFDVDDTLTRINHPIELEVSKRLRDLERKGIKIVFASGKNISYLLGFARGVGVKGSFIIGENGCVLFDTSKSEETR